MGMLFDERTETLDGTVGSLDQHEFQVIIDNHVLPFMYDVHNDSDTFIIQEDNCGT